MVEVTCPLVFIFTTELLGHFWMQRRMKLMLLPITSARSARAYEHKSIRA